MTGLKILKISDVFLPRVNGVSTSIQTFSREFQALGHQVTLIAPEYPVDYQAEFELQRIRSRYLPLDPEDRLMRKAYIQRLLAKLRQQQFDILHIHTPFVAHYQGLWLAEQLELPVIETYHTYFEVYLEQYLKFIPRAWLRMMARHFSRSQCLAINTLVVPTQPMHEVLEGYGLKGRMRVIPTGIPSGQYSGGDRDAFRQQHDIEPQREVLLFVGRAAHEKNIGFLLRMHQQLLKKRPDTLLIIAGEGPALPFLKQHVRHHQLEQQVRFIGYFKNAAQISDCYAAADLFVFASPTETQGLVLLEAMQAGTPVVTTAIMGTAEIMRDGKGGLVAEANETHFAAQVERLLDDKTLYQQCVVEAQQKAAEWSARAMAKKMLELYTEVIEEHRSST